jgi:hypothetical protein
MAVETEVATVPVLALADSDNNRARSVHYFFSFLVGLFLIFKRLC